jgi:hypothetical protein
MMTAGKDARPLVKPVLADAVAPFMVRIWDSRDNTPPSLPVALLIVILLLLALSSNTCWIVLYADAAATSGDGGGGSACAFLSFSCLLCLCLCFVACCGWCCFYYQCVMCSSDVMPLPAAYNTVATVPY